MCIAEMKQGKIKLWTPIEEVESQALDQLKNIATLPWMFHHVAVMPDVHYGKGATVGSVIAMKDAICPAAVGVDIGCGMAAQCTNLKASDLPDSLLDIRHQIERDVPVGFNSHTAGPSSSAALTHMQKFNDLRAPMEKRAERAWHQIGTLGGGNHFIELSLDEEDRVWVVLHSGSRNIGKELAEFHIKVAHGLTHNDGLPDPDLAVFLSGTQEIQDYRHDLMWAQEYAFLNRAEMMGLVIGALRRHLPSLRTRDQEYITCHHNYVSEETHFGEQVLVTRKGAIRASQGDLGIIPGSMGTASYIVEGLGNPESYHSASHGAGRRMSRGQAKRDFTEDDLAEQTKGVECRKDRGVLDEIPSAYKDIDAVMENQKDLVKIKHKLHQLMCVKG